MKLSLRKSIAVLVGVFAATISASANIPGGGSGTGPNVTLVNNGNGTVTIANGIVSILCTTAGGTINQINYTYNNGGGTVTKQLLANGFDGGKLYWENSSDEGLTFTYSVVADPANNGGNYAEIALTTSSVSNDLLEVHYSMLRGSTGFYATPIWSHRNTDGVFGMGECRDNIYAGAIFNWMSVDATRNRLMAVQSTNVAVGVFGAPKEVSLWTNGIYQGRYEDKYKYSADFGLERVWGWSSVGAGAANVGLWNISGSVEYYNGGPMKRELMEHIGTTILNVHNGGHYGGGHDGTFNAGEVWTKVYGPYFIYCNNITNTITATNQAAQALFQDALAQGAAEASAWPYSWFTNVNYAPASIRGNVTGQIVIDDACNPNASASNLWVGLVLQPSTSTSDYDFQEWMKPYQFWVKTDTNGNFTISNVIAGANYTLYAFGPGAAGTFQSQSEGGGAAPNELDIPASPFSVTVTAGTTNDLGAVVWTPTRVGSTVFEIGYPDRTAAKFRHGEDWWVGDIGPDSNDPMPIWTKFLEYPFDFPSGPNYTVGQSRWTTDWNFIQPVVTDLSGNYNGSTSTITFNLAQAPTNGAQACLYLALASDYQGPLIVQVNGNNIAGSTGYFPAYSSSSDESDASIREGIHGAFSDNRISFAGSLLRQGQNTITINMRKGGYFANHAMYDYVRLELQGYVPPPPASMTVYPGNNCNLICWPVTPGSTGYNILRSTTSGSGYVSITNGLTGPVCGSGFDNATFVDTTAANGFTYYYVVQAANTIGASANSPQSSGVTPSAGFSTSPPVAPAALMVTSSGHHSVTLSWSASPGANFYTIQRSTLFDNGGGVSNVLGTITLDNNITATSYTDTSPTDGSIYRYTVTATSAAGTSSNSQPAVAVPLPAAPSSPPGSIAVTAGAGQTNYVASWSPVAGAVGYIVRRGTSSGGPFNFVMSITETNWSDNGLSANAQYFYTIAAVNAGGISASSPIAGPPGIPAALSATPGDGQILLNWSASPGATGYTIKRGLSSGNETTTVATGVTGTGYTDAGLVNGTTYYYVVEATGAGGTSGNSPEASATPSTSGAGSGLVWIGTSNSIWDTKTTNWLNGIIPAVYADGDDVTFNDSAVTANVTVSNAVFPGSVTFTNATLNYVLSTSAGGAGISGSTSLVKNNTGNLTLAGTNAYTGGTVLNAGTLTLNNAAGVGTNTITLNGGTLVLGAVISNPINVAGTATVLPGTIDYNNSPLFGSGLLNVNITGANTFSPQADMSGFSGTIELGGSSGFYRFYGSVGSAAATFDLGTGTTTMMNRNGAVTIQLGSLAGSSTTTLVGASAINAPTTYVVGGNNSNAMFSGRIANNVGTTAIIKTGSGVWTLTGSNTYSGGTTVNGGTLQVNSASGSGTGSGAVTVASGGTLAGSGIVSGPVTVNSGGALAPAPLTQLTLSNNLTLAAGSTIFMQVTHSPLTNNAVSIPGTFMEDGTLNVTNTGATAFTAGDSFQLFKAGTYSGTFANFVLPTLSAGLAWNTNGLNISGTLSVVARTSPTITSVTASGGNLIFSGRGGASYWPYYLLTSTNLASPMSQWTPIATNQFDANGNFTLTNSIDPNLPQEFYRLQLP